ncbi:MAG: protein kinase [Planctomycetaceae bacterium]|nr:protein kinase [Planctomycetaceae bacterium]
MVCPTSEELSSFLSGQLSNQAFEQIAEHLESCTLCVETLDAMETGEPLDAQILQEQPVNYSWAESLGARQLTQRLLDRNNVTDDQLGPDAIGRIKIVRYLASGSFGRVFIGWDEELERRVAVKLPRAGMYADDESREEIRREARQAAKVEHPGIVPIYDIGTDPNGDVFIVSGFVDGCDLSEWRKTQRPSFDECVRMVIKVAEIIAYAHQHQLIHRDIKPGNILIDKEGNPHLVDFGLATTCAEPGERSIKGLVGTPAYLPPDYLEYVHPPIDPRGDLYSLGVVLYELITGCHPYDLQADSWQKTLLTTEPIRPRKRNWRVPRRLESLCQKAVHRDPRKRFQSAEEFLKALERYRRKSSLSELTDSNQSRTPFKLVGAMVLTATIVLGIAMVWGKNIFSSEGGANSFLIPHLPPASQTMDIQSLQPVPVRIQTEPAGALVAIVSLRKHDWSPQTDSIKRPDQTTPVQLDLKPGDYLIEAMLPGYGFHQVIRRVEPIKAASSTSRLLRRITIPQTDRDSHDLVKIPEGEFEFGLPPNTERRHVREFLIQSHEPTYADYKRVMGELTPAMRDGLKAVGITDLNRPLGYLTFQEALEFAEASGLRLLTETEWEYVASNGGTTTYPWGDQFPDVSTWEELGEFDRTINPHHDPIYGLYSGSVEWVGNREPELNSGREHYFYRGGTYLLADGKSLREVLSTNEAMLIETMGVHWRPRWSTPEVTFRLGVRMGRNASLEYLRQEFSHAAAVKKDSSELLNSDES